MKKNGFTLLRIPNAFLFAKNLFRKKYYGEQKNRHQKFLTGFTLIELLVVIAIIGLLASIVLVSLNSARAKARDTRRLADLKNIQTALSLYYDKHGNYPEWSTATWGINCSGFRGTAATSNTFLKPLVDDSFLGAYPNDPQSGNCKYQYRSEKSQQGYRIVVHMENISNTNLSCYPDAYWYCVSDNYP